MLRLLQLPARAHQSLREKKKLRCTRIRTVAWIMLRLVSETYAIKLSLLVLIKECFDIKNNKIFLCCLYSFVGSIFSLYYIMVTHPFY